MNTKRVNFCRRTGPHRGVCSIEGLSQTSIWGHLRGYRRRGSYEVLSAGVRFGLDFYRYPNLSSKRRSITQACKNFLNNFEYKKNIFENCCFNLSHLFFKCFSVLNSKMKLVFFLSRRVCSQKTDIF